MVVFKGSKNKQNIYPSSKLVCQKKRVFAPKRDVAIKEEV